MATGPGAKTTGRPFGKVRLLPSGHWQASYVARGQRHGAPVTYKTEAEARTWLTVQHARLIEGTWRPPAADSPTLKDYAGRWQARRTDLRPTTAALYAAQLERHILPAIGGLRLADLTPAKVEAWTATVRKSGPTVAAQSYRLLRTMLNAAIADGLLVENPCRVKGAGSARVARPERIPSTTDVAAIADAVLARWRACVLLLAWGGLRIGEALAITRSDVDPTAGTVSVRRRVYRIPTTGALDVDAPKTAAGRRVVALPRSVADALAEHLDEFTGPSPGALLWPARGGRYTMPSTFSGVFRDGCDAAGVERFRVHDLRGFALAQAAYSGATVRELQDRAGHATPAAALSYQRSAADRQRQLADRMDEALTAAASVPSLSTARARRRAGGQR